MKKIWIRRALVASSIVVVFAVCLLILPVKPDDSEARYLTGRGATVRRHSATPELSAFLDSEVLTVGRIWKVSFEDTTIVEDDIRALGRLSDLQSLEFVRCRFASLNVFVRLTDLTPLDSLSINLSEIPSGARVRPGQLANLRSLNVSDSQFDEEFLRSTAQLRRVRVIAFLGCRVSQETIDYLSRQLPGVRLAGPTTRSK